MPSTMRARRLWSCLAAAALAACGDGDATRAVVGRGGAAAPLRADSTNLPVVVRAVGIGLTQLVVTPPPPGEVVGEVEFTIVNERTEPWPDEEEGEVVGVLEREIREGWEVVRVPEHPKMTPPGGRRRCRFLVVHAAPSEPADAVVAGCVGVRDVQGRRELVTPAIGLLAERWPVAELPDRRSLDDAAAAGLCLRLVYREFDGWGWVSWLFVAPDGRSTGFRREGLSATAERVEVRAGGVTPARCTEVRDTLLAASLDVQAVRLTRFWLRHATAGDAPGFEALVATGRSAVVLRGLRGDLAKADLLPWRQAIGSIYEGLPKK